jgi:N-acetylmuramoyl-L-alanine amidase
MTRGNPTFLLLALTVVLLVAAGFTAPIVAAADSPIVLPVTTLDGTGYVSLCDAADLLGGRLVTSPIKQKVTLVFRGHEFRFTRDSSVLVVDDVGYRMPLPTRTYTCLHVPAEALLARLTHTLPSAAITLGPAAKPIANLMAAEPPYAARDTFRQATADVARWSLDTIIIDPGHGGRDPGAIGQGRTPEKTITLEVAKRLKPFLESRLGVKVVLTRTNDSFVSLSGRSRLAVAEGGKLFLSLHCNAARNRKAGGLEVYFLSDARTAEAAEVARLENTSLRFEEDEDKSVADLDALQRISMGLLSNQFLKESQDLAAAVRSRLVDIGDLDDRGVKQANFYVMRGTMGSMPSILVEMGFISNRNEEKRLRSGAFQNKLSEAIFEGVKAFKERYERAFQPGP